MIVDFIAFFILIIMPILAVLAVLFLGLDILYFHPKWERNVDSIFKKWDETLDKYERGKITEDEYYNIVGRRKNKK